jgi:hypothetical protein
MSSSHNQPSCFICSRFFATLLALHNHNVSVGHYQCPNCNKSLSSQTALNQHRSALPPDHGLNPAMFPPKYANPTLPFPEAKNNDAPSTSGGMKIPASSTLQLPQPVDKNGLVAKTHQWYI